MSMRLGVWQLGWEVRIMWVVVHLLGVGGLLYLETDLYHQTISYSWLALGYYILLLAVVVQYCCTAGSSPGLPEPRICRFLELGHLLFWYLVDVIREDQDFEASAKLAADSSERGASLWTGEPGRTPRGSCANSGSNRGLGSSSRGNVQNAQGPVSETSPLLSYSVNVKRENSTVADGRRLVDSAHRTDGSNWRCPYCRLWQPLRAKHCHDCDKCVLRFDHHCVWIGTCVGQSNHRRFWWYIFYETALIMWTIFLYIRALWINVEGSWAVQDSVVSVVVIALIVTECFMITLLLFHSYLILTNQTTYELTRRRRIPYLRGLPDKVYPFSKGLKANVHSFCCTPSSEYPIYSLPSPEDLEAMARPSSCFNCKYCSCL